MLRAGLHPRLSLHQHARTAVQPNRAARPGQLQQGQVPGQPPDPHARSWLLRRPGRLSRSRRHDGQVDGQQSGHRVPGQVLRARALARRCTSGAEPARSSGAGCGERARQGICRHPVPYSESGLLVHALPHRDTRAGRWV